MPAIKKKTEKKAEKKVVLKIKGSPLIKEKPVKKKPEVKKLEKDVEKMPKIQTLNEIVEIAEKKKLLVVISSKTTYDINWIFIRRKIIGFTRFFKRKDIVKPYVEENLPQQKTTKKKLSLYQRYVSWFNVKFNHYPSTDNIEDLFE